ncbi:MAG: hypothetical protein KDA41_08925 [Planctomycetales bacterium]|nr:hypothetical protein [Planctomycetales bacterium]
MTHSFQAAQPGGNIAYKGIKIRLGENGAAVLFDTDLLRPAAAWTQSDLDWRNVIYDGSHNTHPRVLGQPVFANAVQPGWAHDRSFADPRALPYGPLPHAWADWKGLYLHGQQVVLSYRVSGADVLESYAISGEGESAAIARHVQVGKSATDLILQIAFDEAAAAQLVDRETLKPVDSPDSAKAVAVLGAPQDAAAVTALACVSSSALVAWDVSEPHHVRLRIPAAATPARVTIASWRGDGEKLGAFASAAGKLTPAADLSALTHGGPARWPTTIVTQGKPGQQDGPFAYDELTLPRDNPWHSWIRPGGFDFFSSGDRAAVCTWSGDVWTVDGVAGDLSKLVWRRIATGMFQPLGLKIINDQIYVSCRDQITRLHDLNGDGETDFYESFNHDHQVTEHFHEFAMGLEIDAAGNFYYAKSARHARTPLVPHHGTLIKVAPDGSTSEIVCNGFRASNGVGIGPHGELATSDQEGHWTPANRLNLIRPGGFYGNMWSFHQGEPPKEFEPPLVWLPKDVDRSPAGQLWDPANNWGPLAGTMVHTSYGTGRLWSVMIDQVDDVVQGAVVRLPLQFPTGIMRGRFHPGSGDLYLCGLVGWSSSAPIDGGFYRVRRTDKPLRMPIAMHVKPGGVELTFTEPLDKKSAGDYQNWSVQQWNYLWSANYGSPEFSVADPRKKGKDDVEVLDIHLSEDGKTVLLELEDLKPVMQMRIRWAIATADGEPLEDSVWLTINRIPK